MYADIVIDISHESLDRPFQYRIPESLVGQSLECGYLSHLDEGIRKKKALF